MNNYLYLGDCLDVLQDYVKDETVDLIYIDPRTTLLLIDSQAVKNTCHASVETKGYCFYKLTNGIKRHLAVDSLGFPFFTHCTKANISDDKGLVEMLAGLAHMGM